MKVYILWDRATDYDELDEVIAVYSSKSVAEAHVSRLVTADTERYQKLYYPEVSVMEHGKIVTKPYTLDEHMQGLHTGSYDVQEVELDKLINKQGEK